MSTWIDDVVDDDDDDYDAIYFADVSVSLFAAAAEKFAIWAAHIVVLEWSEDDSSTNKDRQTINKWHICTQNTCSRF